MKKFFKWSLLVFVAILFIGTFVFLYQRSKKEEISYETYTAAINNLEQTSVVTGSVEPRNEVHIKPQISGIISELYKKAGDEVKEGEIIAKIKVIPDMSTLSAAENRLRLARINYSQAQTDFGREKKLYDSRLISAEEYEKSLQTLRQTKEEVAAAADALEIAKTGVSKYQMAMSTTLIKSTVNGLILDIPIKVGESVIMSNSFNDGTTIATVANMNDLIFKGSIDETEVDRVHKGMPMQITIGALQGKKFDATLEYIAPKVNSTASAANQFEIKAAVRINNKATIRSGYSANAQIVLDKLQQVLTIPEGAIEYEKGKPYVYVLTKEKPQTFNRREIKTGMSDGINIQVLSGLKIGDKVRGNQSQKTE